MKYTPHGVAEIHDQDGDNFCLQAPLINANNSSKKHGNETGCQEPHPGDLGFSSYATFQLWDAWWVTSHTWLLCENRYNGIDTPAPFALRINWWKGGRSLACYANICSCDYGAVCGPEGARESLQLVPAIRGRYSPGDTDSKNLPAMQETWVQSLGQEDTLEEDMATHSSILAWRIPWTEEPGGLQSMGSRRVRHDWNDWARSMHKQMEASRGCGLTAPTFWRVEGWLMPVTPN